MSMLSWLRKTKGPRCPMINAPCREAGCCLWQNIKGKDPQSEELIDQGGCALLWQNTLLVENSQLANQTVASVQSTRNAVVKEVGELRAVLAPRRRGK